MSDFLSSLFMRSRGMVRTLQPRRRSLFEPADAEPGPLARAEPEEGVQRGLSGEPSDLQRVPRVSGSVAPRPSLGETPSSVPPAEVAVKLDPADPSEPAESGVPVEPLTPVARRAGTAPVSEPTLADAPASHARDGFESSSEDLSAAEPWPPQAEESFATKPRFRRADAGKERPQGAGAQVGGQPGVPLLEPPLQIPAAKLEVASPPKRRRRRQTPETTIRVSIGRIDVRAAPDSTPPHRPRKRPQPRLSLDEYLRRRRGGGR